MLTRSSWVFLLACLVGLLVLLAAAATMVLNLGGITADLRDVQHSTLAQLHPGVAAAPAHDLAVASLGAPAEGLRNAAALWPQLLLVLIAGGLMLVLVARGLMLWAGLFTILVIAAALGGSWLLFAKAQLFLEMLSPSLVLAISYVSALFIFALIPVRPSARTVRAPDAAAEPEAPVAAVPAPRRIAAETRTVTYLVCRLRGIGASDDGLDAAGAMTLLESATTPLREAVAQQRGMIAYTSGSRFAAVWNTPSLDDPDHAVHACEAALRMFSGITGLKDIHGEGTPYDALQMGIGIATGPAVLGDTGERNGGYAIIGDCVELADRLSQLSGRYGPAILVSEETRDAAEKNFALLEIDSIATDSGRKPMKVYALYGNPLVRASPKFRALSSFHDHLFQAIRARRWDDARTLIDQCNNLSGAIPQLYDLHLARIGWYQSHPPPEDWDGAFRPPVL